MGWGHGGVRGHLSPLDIQPRRPTPSGTLKRGKSSGQTHTHTQGVDLKKKKVMETQSLQWEMDVKKMTGKESVIRSG